MNTNLNKFLTYITIFVIVIYKIITYINYQKDIFYLGAPDSFSYYMPVDFMNGEVHPSRMFLYPAIIKIMSALDFNNSFVIVVWFQRVISLISIIFLWRLLNKTVKYKIVVLFFVLYYSTNDLVNELDSSVLAESISLSLVIFYIYFLHVHMIERNKNAVYLASLFALLLFFTKPVFVTILFLHCFVLLYLLSWNKYKTLRLNYFVVILFLIVPVLMHCFAMYKQYGYFGLSVIKINNGVANSIRSESFLETKDSLIKNHILSFKDKKNYYEIAFSLHTIMDLKDWKNKLPENYRKLANSYDKLGLSNKREFALNRLSDFVNETTFKTSSIKYFHKKLVALILSFKKLSLTVLFYLITAICLLIQRRKVNLFYLVLTICCFFHILAVTLGGVGDCDSRLLILTLPMLVLLYSNFINKISELLMQIGFVDRAIKFIVLLVEKLMLEKESKHIFE